MQRKSAMTQTEDTEAASEQGVALTSPPARKRWTAVRWVAVLLLTPFALGVLALLVALDRDIAAPAWVVSEIEERAADVLAGGRLDVGNVTVRLGRDLHPRVRMADTTLRDADGLALARIPLIESLFSPRGLVLQREALLQDLRISGAQVNLRRDRDGSVALSFRTGGADVEQASSWLDLLDQSDAVFDRPALAALETIRADGLVVNYQDARAGRAWTVDGGALLLDVRNDETRLQGDFAVLSGGAGITTLALSYESARGSQAAAFSLDLTDASAADIAAQSPALSWLAGVQAPLSATISSARKADGGLAPLTASLSLGAGALQPNVATKPIAFKQANVDLTFDPARNLIAFETISIDGDLGQLTATGQAFVSGVEAGLPQSLTGQFRFADTFLNPSDVFDRALAIPLMQVDMKLDLEPFALTFGQIFAQLPNVAVHSQGKVVATDKGWDASFDISLPEISHADLMALWPDNQIKAVREWIVEAMTAATYEDIQISLRKPTGQALQVAGSLGFRDVEVLYLGTMPPITGGAGTGVFTNDVFAMTVDSGGVTAPQDGWVDLAGSTLVLPDLKADPRPGNYDLRMDGSITALASLLELPPMGFMTRAKLPVDVSEGRAQVRMALTHPMKRGMTGADVSFSATADLRDVASDGLILNRTLQARALSLDIDKDGMEISGRARVDGVPLNGTFDQRFTGAGGGTLQAVVSLTEARMQAFGVVLPAGAVAGEGAVTLRLEIPRGGVPRYRITSDLRGLQIAIPAVGWAKPPSVAGALDVSGRLGPNPQVDSLAISGGGLDVRGDVTFNSAGSLDRARLSRVQIGNWLNAPITLRGRGQGRPFGVEIGGGVIDLRQASFGRGTAESGPISIALDRLQVTQGIALNRFVGEFTSTGGFAGRFDAWINNVGQIQGTVAPRNGRSAVRIISDDAGGVALATGLMRTAVGGSLDLTLLPAGGDGTFDGQLAIRNLRIRDAPAMAALLDAISVVGLLQQLDGQGLAFDAVDASFRLTPERVILTQSSAVGPGLGISLDGLYTLATQQVDFQGVISPLYLINSIGSIFTRRGEGLIGFNFNIGGTAAAPQVSVNPLSAFTPGMFRDIFRRDPPQVNQ